MALQPQVSPASAAPAHNDESTAEVAAELRSANPHGVIQVQVLALHAPGAPAGYSPEPLSCRVEVAGLVAECCYATPATCAADGDADADGGGDGGGGGGGGGDGARTRWEWAQWLWFSAPPRQLNANGSSWTIDCPSSCLHRLHRRGFELDLSSPHASAHHPQT